MQVLLVTCGAWHLRHTAKAFQVRSSLAGCWCTDKNISGIAPQFYRRAWPFHLAMTPFYRGASAIQIERAFYRLFPIWRLWLARQTWPTYDVVQAMMGFATEPFRQASQTGALKVIDCQNSHPTSYFGYWQRECDLWCPGEQVPIPRWMFARMNRELEQADLVLCPSDFVRDTMVQNGIPAAKCLVNPFGVDTEIFKPREELPQVPRFICVASVGLRKGHSYLFRAFEQLKRELPNAELVCVGPLRSDFKQELPRWQGQFQHYPSLRPVEVARLLRSATAFVLPSVEEGFARVLSEAMAAGLPLIVTYETGATTLVRDGQEGFIVPVRDITKLKECMLRLAKDPALCSKMGQAARERGAIRNTWQDYGDRLLAEYQRWVAIRGGTN